MLSSLPAVRGCGFTDDSARGLPLREQTVAAADGEQIDIDSRADRAMPHRGLRARA